MPLGAIGSRPDTTTVSRPAPATRPNRPCRTPRRSTPAKHATRHDRWAQMADRFASRDAGFARVVGTVAPAGRRGRLRPGCSGGVWLMRPHAQAPPRLLSGSEATARRTPDPGRRRGGSAGAVSVPPVRPSTAGTRPHGRSAGPLAQLGGTARAASVASIHRSDAPEMSSGKLGGEPRTRLAARAEAVVSALRAAVAPAVASRSSGSTSGAPGSGVSVRPSRHRRRGPARRVSGRADRRRPWLRASPRTNRPRTGPVARPVDAPRPPAEHPCRKARPLRLRAVPDAGAAGRRGSPRERGGSKHRR